MVAKLISQLIEKTQFQQGGINCGLYVVDLLLSPVMVTTLSATGMMCMVYILVLSHVYWSYTLTQTVIRRYDQSEMRPHIFNVLRKESLWRYTVNVGFLTTVKKIWLTSQSVASGFTRAVK